MKYTIKDIDPFFLQTPERKKMFMQVVKNYKSSRDATNKKLQDFFNRLDNPLRQDLINILNTEKLVNMIDGFAVKILTSASLDLKPTTQLLNDVSYATHLGNAHILIIDKVIDNKFSSNRRLVDVIPLAEVCFLDFLFSIIKLTGTDEDDLLRIKNFYYKTFEVMYWEEKEHVGKISQYSREDIEFIAQKCAPIKSIFYPILKHTGKLAIADDIFKIIDNVSLCFLLFDDFKDWKEDLLQQRYTYPLTLALNRIGIKNEKEIPTLNDAFINEVEKAISISEVPYIVQGLALEKLEEGYSLSLKHLPTTAMFIEERIKLYKENMKEFITHHSKLVNFS